MSKDDGSKFFGADSEVAKLCRQLDWDTTPLGPPQTWSDALKTTARMVLESRFPMALGWGPDFAQIYNDDFVPILGNKHPDALGRPFSEVYSEIWDQTGPLLTEVYQNGAPIGFEDRFFLIERSGFLEETYFTFSFSPVRNPDGDVAGLLVTSNETTPHVLAQRRAETLSRVGPRAQEHSVAEILKETLARLEDADRDLPWCVAYEFQPDDGERRSVGAVGLGLSDDELDADILGELGDVIDASDDQLDARIELDTVHIETVGERPPSTTFICLPIREDGGATSDEVGGLIVGLSDWLAFDTPYRIFLKSILQALSGKVQQHLYRDIQLTNAERRYSAVFEHSLDAMMLAKPDGTILQANPSMCELLGYSEDQLREVGREGIIDTEDARIEKAIALRTSIGEFRGEINMLHRDGHVIPCELSSRNYQDAEGKTRTSVVLRDLRERLQLEASLRQSQKLEVIGKLAGGAAHDFNNLLTAIDVSAQFLEESTKLDADAAEDVSVIRNASERAAALTQRLLAFSRAKSLQTSVLDPAGIVEGLKAILRSLLNENIEVQLDIEPEVRSISASRQSIEQVLLNLVVNAQDAMPNGGTLTVALANREFSEAPDDVDVGELRPGKYVQLTVTDSGEGLPAEQPARLFEPFYTTKKQGTGLGLSTVAEIVLGSSGAIRVDSEPGVETRFEIFLPATDEAPTEADVPTSANASLMPLSARVLLIEDQPRVRQVTAKMLKKAGLEVTAAAGGAEAIDLLESSSGDRFDIVISDVVMPNMNGVEAVNRLREIDPALKFLFISGYPDQVPMHLSKEGPVKLVRKPFTNRTLLDAVASLID